MRPITVEQYERLLALYNTYLDVISYNPKSKEEAKLIRVESRKVKRRIDEMNRELGIE
jgi:hypothetical protein